MSYDLHQIEYTYDALSRLLEADYNSGATVYGYGYDPAGNLVSMDGVTRTYNAANQMTHDGTNALTYDANGNLTHDGTNAYTWDRANRMIQMGSTAYAYDGLDNRIAQTNSGYTTTYINDVQPGLTQVVAQINGASTDRFVHGPRGVQAQYDGSAWQYTLQDGLNSVRGLVDASATVQQRVNYSEYGEPDTSITGFAFTGEVRDANGLQYHRARYYAPEMGIFPSLDPFEGMVDRPMSLNGYSWAEGNPVTNVDPSGMFIQALVGACIANPVACAATVAVGVGVGVAVGAAMAIQQFGKDVACALQPDADFCQGDTTVNELACRAIEELLQEAINPPKPYSVEDAIKQSFPHLYYPIKGAVEMANVVTGVHSDTQVRTDEDDSSRINIDTSTAQALTTADPAAVVTKGVIAGYTAGKQMVMTMTALFEWYGQLGTVAGTSERWAAIALEMEIEPIPDNPSERVMRLRETQRLERNDKIIFGTADHLGILTISADAKFLRAAQAQGVNLYSQVLLHEAFSYIGE